MRHQILRAALAALTLGALMAAPAQAQRRGEAIAYKDPGYRGASIRISGPVHNLALERFNDTISSIELRGAWEICVDPDFRGKCTVIDGSVARLSDIRMNDNITSLRRVNGRRGSDRSRYGDRRGYDGAITLFKDPNYRGQAVHVDNAIPNLTRIRFNDTISSIRVNRGQWLVCEHPDYRGRCEVIDGSVGSLNYIGLNDRITSIRPYSGRRDRRRDADYNNRDRDWRHNSSYGHSRTRQFDDPRDQYGDRIPARRGNARRYCNAHGYDEVVEVETSGRYLGCVICAR